MESANTSNNSFFFSEPTDLTGTGVKAMELLHSSDGGWFELWRFDKNGKFRVLKALKEKYRGDSLCEDILKKEYEISYVLDHHNICETYSYYEHPELGMCMEIEWVDGCTLDYYLKNNKISYKEELRLISELCSALSYVHSKQIIHRDLKPSNILVTHNGHNVKLIDFGLADSSSHTYLKEGAGTSLYASPEQLSGETQDNRSDIYSLGVILSEFPSSRRFSYVIGNCLKSSPQDRYDCIEDLRHDLSVPRYSRYIYALILAIVLPVAALLLFTSTNGSETSLDVESIDQIFNEATQMVMDGAEPISSPDD